MQMEQKHGVILLESDSSLAEHGLIDHGQTAWEWRAARRRRHGGVNKIFILDRICSSQPAKQPVSQASLIQRGAASVEYWFILHAYSTV